MNFIYGFMYPLHLTHRTGPNSPVFTTGGNCSSRARVANGVITRPNGISA